MMRALMPGIAGLLACGLAQATEVPLERHSLGSWEADIGYSGVVRDGDTLHISGVPCRGKDMPEAVQRCYGKLNEILQRFGADSSQVVKETAFTTDMDALVKAIPERKAFFADGRYPAASWVQVERLFNAQDMLEVEWTVRLK
ncbi:RidA family protein [Stenotrophomonas sp.]|uniref:RidA family protein n=1 Tax=Stenotrophomonas sp. TaxID=69392 RepID=UPI0028ACE84B|nr:RidA family protein [Stenotrophomonas sp.]